MKTAATIFFLFCATVIQAQTIKKAVRVRPSARQTSAYTGHVPTPFPPFTQWEPYTGQQSPEWPRDEKPRTVNLFRIPVVLGYPDRQYEILGYVYVSYSTVKNPRSEAMRVAAQCAKLHGADAIFLRPAKRNSQYWYAAGTAVRWIKQ